MDSSTNSLDDGSADGSAGFPDQPSMMEVRLQAQEDEITLLKSSLADALRKLRLHDQLLHLLKQQLIAVNPGAARTLNNVCSSEGVTSSRRLHSSSAGDGISNHATSQLLEPIVTNVNGQNVNASSVPSKSLIKPATADRWTQTDSDFSGPVTWQNKPSFPTEIRGLQLEDMLPTPEPVVEGTRAKLHRTPGLEEEDELEQEKGLSWASSVEKPIEATTIGDLHSGNLHSGDPPDGSCSDSASVRSSQAENSRCGPLAPIQEGETKQLCVGPPPPNSNHFPNNQSLHCI